MPEKCNVSFDIFMKTTKVRESFPWVPKLIKKPEIIPMKTNTVQTLSLPYKKTHVLD